MRVHTIFKKIFNSHYMNISDFKRIVISFADKQSDVQLEKGRLLMEIRGELIDAQITIEDEILYILDENGKEKATIWIRNRLAGLPQLADRIIDYTQVEENFVNPTGKLLD